MTGLFTWTGKPLPLRVSPSDAYTTVHGYRQTHTNTFSDTQSHRHIHHLKRQRQTHRHWKHTCRHILTYTATHKYIASQRHTSTHRDAYKYTYKQTHKHIDAQTSHGFIIPRPSEQGSDQGPKRVQRGLCSWERAASTAI